MKEKFKKFKCWMRKIDKKKIKNWFVNFKLSQLNWIRLGVIVIWTIALLNLIQFFNAEEYGTTPVYVKVGSLDIDEVHETVNV